MRKKLFFVVSAICFLQAQAQSNDLRQQFSDTVQAVVNKASSKVNETVSDIKDNSKQLSHDIESSGNSLFGEISAFLKNVLSDIISLVKSIFGETDSPGQPALPAGNPPASLTEPTQTSQAGLKKFVCLSTLVALAWYAFAMRGTLVNHEKIRDYGYDYRNIESVPENIL